MTCSVRKGFSMKRVLITILFVAMVISQACAAATEYTLKPLDVVTINVWGYPELSYPAPGNPDAITIRSDGKFLYPLAGEIQAEGLTPVALAQEIQNALSQCFVNPQVTVNLLKFSTERVYVLGEVNQPGLYELDKSRTLIDAVSAAKGWTKDAAKTKVFIIRKDEKNNPICVNLLDLLKKGELNKNLLLREGDIIFFTENNRIDITRDILPLTQIFYNIKHTANNNNG